MDDLIQSQAERILEQKPDPGVHYRLLRDVIHLPSEDYELSWAKKELSRSRWVRE